MCKTYDYVLRPVPVDFEEFSVVHDGVDDLVHIIGFVEAVGDYFIKAVVHPVVRV